MSPSCFAPKRKLRGLNVRRGRSYEELEAIAANVRSIALPNLGATDPVNGLHLFESVHRYKIQVRRESRLLGLDTAIRDDLPDGVEAVTMFEDGVIVICLTEDSYSKLERGAPRATFTVCHEIGHGVLHAPVLRTMRQMPHAAEGLYRGTMEHPPYQDSEWQANAFAGALLMPADGVVSILRDGGTEHDVANVFHASLHAARIRVQQVSRRQSELAVAAQRGRWGKR